MKKNHIFHAEERIYNLQISLSELVLLSDSTLFALSMTIHTEHKSPCVKHDNSRSTKRSKVVIFKISTIKLWGIVLGTSSQNLKMIPRLTNPGSQLY